MSKLKQMLKQATIGELFKNPSGMWTAFINLPDHCAAIQIQIHQSELLEAKKMRHIIVDALHKYGKEEDTGSWRKRNRMKQEAGVKFEKKFADGTWKPYLRECFLNIEENYREVHHEAERKLWKAQREAGTNEQWQHRFEGYSDYFDIPVGQEPIWTAEHEYRIKPKPAWLTAKIVCNRKMTPEEYQIQKQDWKFYGTPEEYRAECEKYGYAVISDIEEVKPKTVMYYFCMVDSLVSFISIKGESKEEFRQRLVRSGHAIIGNIEEREVEI